MYNSNDYTHEDLYSLENFNQFVSKVFGWMFVGLLLTAMTSFFMISNATIFYTILSNNFIYYGIFIAEFIIVVYFSARILKMTSFQAGITFTIYSILNGITLSVIFAYYTASSIFQTFIVTCLTFGIMAMYGYFTKTNLNSIGSILFIGLIGVIVLSVVNIFLGSSTIEWIISIVGLLVFWGLTAYDMQKLKSYFVHGQQNLSIKNNLALMGALQLYLDFINIFILLLRFFGRRR